MVPQQTGEGMANDAAEEGCGRLDLFTLGVNAPPVLVAPEVTPEMSTPMSAATSALALTSLKV